MQRLSLPNAAAAAATGGAALCFALVFFAPTDARADEAPTPEATPPVAPSEPEKVQPPTSPRAPERRAFGTKGTIVLDDLLGLGFGSVGGNDGLTTTGWLRYADSKSEQAGLRVRTTTLMLAPTIDVFIAAQLSLGAQVTLFHSTVRMGSESSTRGAKLRPRIGWAMPITDELAFWPRAFGSIGVTRAATHDGGMASLGGVGGFVGGPEQSNLAWAVGGEGMFVARIGRSVALTLGPTISYGKVDALDAKGPNAFGSTAVSAGVRGAISLVL